MLLAATLPPLKPAPACAWGKGPRRHMTITQQQRQYDYWGTLFLDACL